MAVKKADLQAKLQEKHEELLAKLLPTIDSFLEPRFMNLDGKTPISISDRELDVVFKPWLIEAIKAHYETEEMGWHVDLSEDDPNHPVLLFS